jgi:ubiquinone biosynthesis UbiH/UbiF/VisC/COQ6 family hydroxylase
MRVFGDTPGASIEFDAYRAGVPELAWIVEDGALQSALWAALGTQDGLQLFAPAKCESLEVGELARVTLSDGQVIEAELIIGADGADSFVRNAAGIAVKEKPYGQTAVVANFAIGKAHDGSAYQWFRGDSVLALLPLPGHRVSMVWSVSTAHAAQLAALDGAALADEVSAASKEVLGPLTALSAAHAFPLRRMTASRMVLAHLALAGDAAHVIHPLAGQGLNLGLQDARALGALLAERKPIRKPGDIRLLRSYERQRAEAILAMRTAVNGLQSLFGSESPNLRRVRNLGLNLTDRLPVIKNILLRHALD